ncbi:hypothetical protein SAMN05216388_100941 [Halorientalis persicus]|uniref:Uncharacterized protein n=1 Tax=Halorientalis persicus TaxID=1367881 RepID=A0A1H8ML58_9EURY|nr:hypothetical protein [Halorientalis persicus]SEO18171.1 hypothetical protein SAMN05216388_100941 [Halorientalis persicus]
MTAAETTFRAEKQADLARRAAREFDSIPLRKQVRDDIQDDPQLGHLLDAVAHLRCAVHEREQETGTESMLYRELETAQNGVTGYAEDSRISEIIAQACATVIEDGAEWGRSDSLDQEHIDEAVTEARQWLSQHTDIAGRLDLLDLVPDPPECDGSSRVRVTFIPQTWHKGRLVPAEKREHFVVPAEDATDESGSLYDDGSCKAKQLWAHDNAPEQARDWEGPFTVTLDWV